MAKMTVTIAKLKTKFTACASVAQPPNIGAHHLPSAASAALAISDTISRKPMPITMLKDSSRTRTMLQTPLLSSRAGARQMRSMGVLQLAEDRGGADHQDRDAHHRGDDALHRLVDGFQHALHGQRALGAHQAGELGEDLAARRVAAEHQPATEITISSSGATEKIV